MSWRKLFLVLVVFMGISGLSSKEARANSCWFEPYFWESPPAIVRGILYACMQDWYVPVTAVTPFRWGGMSNGSSGNFWMYEWLGEEEDHAIAVFDLRYDLSRHGFSSSLDDLPLGTSFSSISFSVNPQYMGITLDEWASGVMARGTASLASARLDFMLGEPVVLTERLDSKALFLSDFANISGGWGAYGGGHHGTRRCCVEGRSGFDLKILDQKDLHDVRSPSRPSS